MKDRAQRFVAPRVDVEPENWAQIAKGARNLAADILGDRAYGYMYPAVRKLGLAEIDGVDIAQFLTSEHSMALRVA